MRHLFSYNTKVTRSIWNEDLGVWTVYYKSLPSTNSPESPASDADLPEESFDCEFLYNTNRITNEPGLPLIPGAIEGEFKGEWWHSMRWPSNGLARLQGKKVAMIGCAAAAVQLVPQIAKVAGSLAVYHRTPNYVLHRPNQPYDEEQKRRWAADPMEYRLWRAKWEHDFARNWVYGALHDGSVEQLSCIADARDNLDSNIADPKLREILWPDFPLWCRRTVYHDDFYPALELPHVELVQERIVRTSSTGIISALQNPRDKEIDTLAPEVSREFDVIVYATGWAATGNKKPSAPVIGRNGVEFSQRAVNLVPDGPEGISYQGYLGVMLDGFPNYFTLTRGGFFCLFRGAAGGLCADPRLLRRFVDRVDGRKRRVFA